MKLVLLYFLLSFISITVAQSETLLYSWGFSSLSDWIIEETGKGIDFKTTYCETEICLNLEGQAIVRRIIPTTGYHSIRIRIDVREVALEQFEYCKAGYTTDLTSAWEEVTLAEKNDRYQCCLTFSVLNNAIYNNQSTFQLRLENTGTSATDDCYFDNLEVYGIAYTASPTNQQSIEPTVSPSSEPTLAPTIEPTISTNNPSFSPTNNPSVVPTRHTLALAQSPTSNEEIAVDIITTTSLILTVENALDSPIEGSNELAEWVYVAMGCGAVFCCLSGVYNHLRYSNKHILNQV